MRKEAHIAIKHAVQVYNIKTNSPKNIYLKIYKEMCINIYKKYMLKNGEKKNNNYLNSQ